MKTRTMHVVFVVTAIVGLLVLGGLISGCSDRANPVRPERTDFTLPQSFAYHFPSLDGADILEAKDGRSDGRMIHVYTPPGYAPRGEGRPYPVLYLLHDFGYDYRQFEIYNLSTLATEMINKGEIEPMIIVTPDASNLYGGGMYANSEVTGDYEDMIVPELLYAIEEAVGAYNVNIDAGRDARAIGGLGFGGQAALKIAIKHPDLFSSASAMNAPLAFAGDGGTTTDGLQGLFKYFFIENGIEPGDEAGYMFVPQNDVPIFDRPITQMIIAMSAAFSPTIDVAYPRPWTVKDTVPGYTTVVLFDLPFDHELYVENPVWERWLQQDVRTIYAADPGALDDVDVYIEASTDDDYGFNAQSALFAEDLDSRGTVDYEYHTYSGTSKLASGHDRLIAQRLAEVLKFHSARLAQAASE